MSNFRIVVDDIFRGAIITATSEAMPAANLASPKRSEPWRSSTLDPQTINAIFAARQVQGLCLAHHNLSQDAEVTVTLKLTTATVATFEVPVNDTATWTAWISPVEADECDIAIVDASNPAGYLEVVQALGGPAVTADCNFELGGRVRWRKAAEHRYTAGGSLRSWGNGLVHREVSIDLRWVRESDRANLIRQLAAAGDAVPMLLSLYPELGGTQEADHSLVAKFVSDLDTDRWGRIYSGMPLEFWET